MNSMPTDSPLTPEELDRLSAFLESDQTPPETLWLDGLHGFLTAVLCLPDLLAPSQWLPVIWEGAEPDFETEQQAQEILERILRLYNEIAVTLMEQRPYAPMMLGETLDDGSTEFDAHGWCHGFVRGLQLSPSAWDDEDISDALLPMIILSEMIRRRLHLRHHSPAAGVEGGPGRCHSPGGQRPLQPLPVAAHRRQAPQAPRRQGGAQRTLSLWQRPEVQAVLRHPADPLMSPSRGPRPDRPRAHRP